MSEKRGLARYVREGPAFGSLLVAVFLLPFWVTSEIVQMPWREWQRVLAVVLLWAISLGGLAAATERSRPLREARRPTPTSSTAATTSSTETPTTTPSTEPTAAPAPSAPPPTRLVSGVLSQLRVAPENARAGYERELFDHWNDDDGDGCNTRYEVLIAESLDAVAVSSGCEVSGGRWFSVYDGETTTNPSDLDVDHFVPLAEAWDSGANSWTPPRRAQFANDLGYEGSLIAVSDNSNSSKSERDPAEWMPPRGDFHCEYARTWIAVKVRWTLTADAGEVAALETLLGSCP